MKIEHPYLMFLGDAPDELAAKTAIGIKQWRPEWCKGQLRLENCNADLGLPDMTIAEAREAGVKTLVLGVANRGGIIGPVWMETLLAAIDAGMDIANGLHTKLSTIPELAEAAAAKGVSLFDVRHFEGKLPVGSGEKRSGKRVLAVGTDCSVGKMYTALAIEAEMKQRGIKSTFRATGQTGIFIAGEGISVDAVISDFISGAVETIAPANDPDHWDVVEGQGSLFHASYAGVSMGLLHGAQADAIVVCHEPTRTHMRGLPGYSLPDLKTTLEVNLMHARLTNPDCVVAGFAINTKALDDAAATKLMADIAEEFGLPCVDPVRNGVAPIVDKLQEI
ncbi:N-acetyltransferase DgcN [Thalassospira marina]|uniref:EBNA-1 nuclear protein n=1 Tax=Thalassospira marina TaxID=2048283 RepID=A0A2N3KSA6_9PROT|nr:N-acetyltransferase DgcN [Thalassospira marina]AUG52506.1 EBNA-1 nuclear protein [Thalassospira marina]PKR53376.1 EBNA-1 nuclear protein [Thalassospira marina]